MWPFKKKVEIPSDNEIAIKHLEARELEIITTGKEAYEGELNKILSMLEKMNSNQKIKDESELAKVDAKKKFGVTKGDILKVGTTIGLTVLGFFLSDYDPQREKRLDRITKTIKL